MSEAKLIRLTTVDGRRIFFPVKRIQAVAEADTVDAGEGWGARVIYSGGFEAVRESVTTVLELML